MFAILNNLEVKHEVTAICEMWTYDVWGNEEDGWEVNDRFCQDRELRVPAVVKVSNFPRCPGASDNYRSFSKSASFSCEVCVSFEIENTTLEEIFESKNGIEVDGDGDFVDAVSEGSVVELRNRLGLDGADVHQSSSRLSVL
jgi:hypothetical protein